MKFVRYSDIQVPPFRVGLMPPAAWQARHGALCAFMRWVASPQKTITQPSAFVRAIRP